VRNDAAQPSTFSKRASGLAFHVKSIREMALNFQNRKMVCVLICRFTDVGCRAGHTQKQVVAIDAIKFYFELNYSAEGGFRRCQHIFSIKPAVINFSSHLSSVFTRL
jgi:hypothetical protein